MPGHNHDVPKYIIQVPAQTSRSLQKRPQTRHQPQRRNRKGNPVRCNKCKTSLSGTFYLLKCNCILCEECTYSHFEKSKNCPSCNRIMGENDFTELMIRKELPSHKQRENLHRRIFVKRSAESRVLKSSDMWYRIQQQHSLLREGTKFFLRQFMKENNLQTKKSSQIQHALLAMNEDRDALRRESHKHKQKVETFKQELILAHEKLDEKDRQLKQFRKIISSKNGSSPSRDENSRHAGTTGGERESFDRPSARPRRVSDQHNFEQPPTHGRNADDSNRSNPYKAQQRRRENRQSVQTRGNPYNGDFPPLSQEHHSRHNRNSNPYREQKPAPSTRRGPPPSRSHSVGSGGANSGGKIRNITASTPYAFSGSERQVADGRNKRSLSPSHFYAPHPSKDPRGYHSQSY